LKRRNSLSVAVPASMVAEHSDLRDKTTMLAQVGRAAAIYRVDEIIVYPDKPDESLLMKYILGYMETPQYLRKHLFKRRPELRYAGTLPPLRTLHHPTEDAAGKLKVGEVRDGVVTEVAEGSLIVDIGVDKLLTVKGRGPSRGSRITVMVTHKEPQLLGRPIKKSQLDEYWGYDLRGSRVRLGELALSPEWDLTVATSRLGAEITVCREALEERWVDSRRTLVAFGSYKEGVHEIVGHEGRRAEECFQYIVNTVPAQGTQTVRTEEAIHASLAILNTFKD
jgi:predicted SPOUT superfamily RNA methylase MTH1